MNVHINRPRGNEHSKLFLPRFTWQTIYALQIRQDPCAACVFSMLTELDPRSFIVPSIVLRRSYSTDADISVVRGGSKDI